MNLVPTCRSRKTCSRAPAHVLGSIRWREMNRRAQEALRRLKLGDRRHARPWGRIHCHPADGGDRPGAGRAGEALILDEANEQRWTRGKVRELLAVLRQLRGEGLGIIFVTTSSTRFTR